MDQIGSQNLAGKSQAQLGRCDSGSQVASISRLQQESQLGHGLLVKQRIIQFCAAQECQGYLLRDAGVKDGGHNPTINAACPFGQCVELGKCQLSLIHLFHDGGDRLLAHQVFERVAGDDAQAGVAGWGLLARPQSDAGRGQFDQCIVGVSRVERHIDHQPRRVLFAQRIVDGLPQGKKAPFMDGYCGIRNPQLSGKSAILPLGVNPNHQAMTRDLSSNDVS